MHCSVGTFQSVQVQCAIGGWAMLDERGLPGADLPIELFHPPSFFWRENIPLAGVEQIWASWANSVGDKHLS